MPPATVTRPSWAVGVGENEGSVADTSAALWVVAPVGQVGWYRSPEDARGHRYWDGERWDVAGTGQVPAHPST
ncbi:DUF2510 domain-containing protein [Nocardioides aequoreus]|uniref:DUF2510 domain-containing protein n=1 Tax=Nocardioides aequoreus TaxID=397278 RepID=UPI0004C39B05|nr:DUF2510 domain-containing protein [Nocardioides aequoreus]